MTTTYNNGQSYEHTAQPSRNHSKSTQNGWDGGREETALNASFLSNRRRLLLSTETNLAAVGRVFGL